MAERAERGAEISVVVVSYNTADLIGPCLASLSDGQDLPLEIFVVDNASSDGSAEAVRRGFPSVRLVENRENRGFGAANNLVLPRCSGRYVVLLNPDTVVRPGALRALSAYMDAHPRVGLAGPALVNPDGTPQESVALRYPGQRRTSGELDGLPGSIACVMGACQIVRPELLRRIGGFDEDFFLYGEDQDLCLRIRKAGYEIGHAADAQVVHVGGQSERGAVPAAVFERKLKAEYLFYEKHYRAGTVRAIMAAHRARAAWRLALLAVARAVTGGRTGDDEKARRYRALREFVRRRAEGAAAAPAERRPGRGPDVDRR